MSEPDKYDCETIEMIPCHRLCQDHAGIRFHSGNCCYGVRPAVAARLRADGAEIDRLRTAITDAGIHDWTQYKNEITSLRDELSQLRAQLAALTEDRDTHKRIAERNHKANLMPCPKCGYKQATIEVKR